MKTFLFQLVSTGCLILFWGSPTFSQTVAEFLKNEDPESIIQRIASAEITLRSSRIVEGRPKSSNEGEEDRRYANLARSLFVKKSQPNAWNGIYKDSVREFRARAILHKKKTDLLSSFFNEFLTIKYSRFYVKQDPDWKLAFDISSDENQVKQFGFKALDAMLQTLRLMLELQEITIKSRLKQLEAEIKKTEDRLENSRKEADAGKTILTDWITSVIKELKIEFTPSNLSSQHGEIDFKRSSGNLPIEFELRCSRPGKGLKNFWVEIDERGSVKFNKGENHFSVGETCAIYILGEYSNDERIRSFTVKSPLK